MNVAALLKSKGGSVSTAAPSATLLEVTQKLSERKIGAIVIIGEQGSVDGIISERDIVHVISQRGMEALNTPVGDVMTKDLVSCDRSFTVDELMSMMTRGRFRHVPVIEDGALIGIVSIGDVVKNHIAEVEMEVSAMRGYLATG
ncbi:MAG: CBS domain-containing protein [Hyphomicrobiaceae bacterium]